MFLKLKERGGEPQLQSFQMPGTDLRGIRCWEGEKRGQKRCGNWDMNTFLRESRTGTTHGAFLLLMLIRREGVKHRVTAASSPAASLVDAPRAGDHQELRTLLLSQLFQCREQAPARKGSFTLMFRRRWVSITPLASPPCPPQGRATFPAIKAIPSSEQCWAIIHHSSKHSTGAQQTQPPSSGAPAAT